MPSFLKLSILFCAILTSGALGKSFFMRECSNIAKEMKRAESEIRILNRENDFWDAEIAKMQAPSSLRAKAGSMLAPPAAESRACLRNHRNFAKRRKSPKTSALAQSRRAAQNIQNRKEMKCSPFISKWRYRAVLFGTVGIFCIMLWRLYDLHIIESKNSKDAVQSQRQIVSPISAKRGNITDARGNILATSRSVIDLGVDPEAIKEKFDRPETQEKLSKMAHILNLPLSEILEKCKSEEIISPSGRIIKRRWKLIAKVEENVYEEISALKIYGITGDRKYVRTYPSEGLAAHVIGFVNKEGVAVDGIEKNADWYLKGQEGWIQSEKDARRRELAHFRTREVPATDGMNIELSIDIIIQEMANRQLQKIVEEFNPENATIIVSDPATGFILALANYPSFDPNNYNKYPVANLKNFALSSQIEPGSTFKIVPISAALNEGLVTQDDTFDCAQPTLTHRGRILKLPPDDHPAGVLSVRQIAEKSSNRGSAQLGAMLGEQKLFEYAKMFGYGSKTNIGLSGEINGVLMNPKNWDGLTITRLPMGHAVAATPLQIHCSMATLANQGVYMRPQLIKRIFSEKTGNA